MVCRQVDASKYPRVSSYTRAAALGGRFLSGVAAQLLTHFHLMDYRQLNYITLSGTLLYGTRQLDCTTTLAFLHC